VTPALKEMALTLYIAIFSVAAEVGVTSNPSAPPSLQTSASVRNRMPRCGRTPVSSPSFENLRRLAPCTTHVTCGPVDPKRSRFNACCAGRVVAAACAGNLLARLSEGRNQNNLPSSVVAKLSAHVFRCLHKIGYRVSNQLQCEI